MSIYIVFPVSHYYILQLMTPASLLCYSFDFNPLPIENLLSFSPFIIFNFWYWFYSEWNVSVGLRFIDKLSQFTWRMSDCSVLKTRDVMVFLFSKYVAYFVMGSISQQLALLCYTFIYREQLNSTDVCFSSVFFTSLNWT